ncbi:cytochrome c oxidase assembly protein [Planctomonas sp. JC2975]|uniref:cytochrome c oxidase assembly protein n=1 Tax=Planctomonas sp. JC2975 TaxID=2729626 RepID=UPI003211E5C4
MVAGGLYGLGVFFAHRNGVRWPAWPIVAFYLLGLGSYAWIEFGFLGTWSTELRWAFTTRVAFLLFVVPGLLALGRPVTLARSAMSGLPARVLDRILKSWPIRMMGNAIFAPVVALIGFSLFLTPFAAALRLDPAWEAAISIGIPLVGLLMVLPVTDSGLLRTSLFITAEFMLAFVELVLDAVPGILLRLNESVLDHAPPVIGLLPPWFPSPLHDQHLSGDFLWFIAEIADVPVLIILFIRWMHSDRREAKKMDELTDEQMDQLTQEHLKRYQQH